MDAPDAIVITVMYVLIAGGAIPMIYVQSVFGMSTIYILGIISYRYLSVYPISKTL